MRRRLWLKKQERSGSPIELWVTSLHDGQLRYECVGTHLSETKAMDLAIEEGGAVRTVLVELKQDGKVIWTYAGNRRGRHWNRLHDDDDDDDDDAVTIQSTPTA